MTSVQPAKQILLRSNTIDSGAPLIRFNSARVAPEKVADDIGSPPPSPFELRIDDGISLFNEYSSDLFPIQKSTNSTTDIPTLDKQNDGERTVKISEYHAVEKTLSEPLTSRISPKKLHHYILLTPRTICLVSLFILLSLATVLIGLGITISHQQSQLDYRCPVISYCPRNTSYTILCNMTNEYCACYNTRNELIGCMAQRQYGDACYRSQECSIQQNLQCNINIYQCQCLSHYLYNGSICIPMLTYGELCSMLNDTCDYSSNLTCLTGNRCTCDTNVTFWNGEYCELYRSINAPCNPYKIPSGCSMIFICDNSTATCQCPLTTYFDDNLCLSYSSYLEPCYDTSSCLPNTQLACAWGLCQCDDLYFYWSSLTSACVYPKQIQYNSSCNYQTSCESDFGLRCINGRCLCEVNSYWTPGNYCDIQSQYNEQCLTAPCLGNTGLICPSNTSICTCPKYSYWDNLVCQTQRIYTAFCLIDSWCRLDLGLRCRNHTCTCSLCATCFWDGVRCRDCPTSWEIVVSNGTIQPRVYCYLKVNSYIYWNESVASCSTEATSYFGAISHLIYINDVQELQDVSTFATTSYYDIFVGHTNRFNYSQWFLANGTLSPPMQWCSGFPSTFSSLKCARLLISLVCITDIPCSGWPSRYVCELD